MLLNHLFIGTILICITVIIHAVCLDFLIRKIEGAKNSARLIFKQFWKTPLIVTAVLGVFCAHILQIWVWAVFYIYVDALPTMEESLYFSTSTFTTVGYGDIVLSEDWRLVSSFQSANGFILFGWSTAFIFEVMSQLYRDESHYES